MYPDIKYAELPTSRTVITKSLELAIGGPKW